MNRSVAAVSVLSSWAELSVLIERCADGTWLFRGEATVGFPLQPKAGRVGNQRGSARKTKYVAAHEQAALELFKRQARPHVQHIPETDLEWLAIAQHHGMSTRLLDWTESALVATYFAVEQAGTRGDAVLYGVRGLRKVSKSQERDPFVAGSPEVYVPPHITPRIPAQRSVFTLHPEPTRPFVPSALTTWTISAQVCAQIKRVLDACAINESSLFPDVDGLSRYLGWRYKWGKL